MFSVFRLISRKPVAALGILVVFALAFFPLFLRPASAESPSVYKSKIYSPSAIAQVLPEPIKVKVGVYVLQVGNLDISSGTYSMDFYLQFLCDRPCDEPAFDIMNSSEISAENQTSDSRGGTFYTYRVKANLSTNLDLRKYPFDSHLLSVAIEDKNLGANEMVYENFPGLSGVDPEAVVSGWDIDRAIPHGVVTDHFYPMFSNSPYSRISFQVRIFHNTFSSFMKGLFAAIVIVLVGMLSFLMKHTDVSDRLALTSSTLVGAILYHLTLTAGIPPVGYLTFADKFMIGNYVITFAALAVTVMLMWYVNHGLKEQAVKLHCRTRLTVPALWIVLMVSLTILEFAQG
jgi:hypothetical protein